MAVMLGLRLEAESSREEREWCTCHMPSHDRSFPDLHVAKVVMFWALTCGNHKWKSLGKISMHFFFFKLLTFSLLHA